MTNKFPSKIEGCPLSPQKVSGGYFLGTPAGGVCDCVGALSHISPLGQRRTSRCRGGVPVPPARNGQRSA